MAAWGFHVAALALAPISLVQSVIAGGLALVTIFADRLFGLEVSRREWIGVIITAAGLALLAATLGNTGDSKHGDWQVGDLTLYAGLVTLAAVSPPLPCAGDPPQAGPVLGLSAGMLWGASDVSIKALSGRLGDLGPLVLVHPLALVILLLSLVGLVVSARSLQLGPSVAVIAITTTAGNIVTIAAGPIVFGEPLPDSTPLLVLRIIAFAMVCVAAGLTPGPTEPDQIQPAGNAPAGTSPACRGNSPRAQSAIGSSVAWRSPTNSRTRTVAPICRSAAFGVSPPSVPSSSQPRMRSTFSGSPARSAASRSQVMPWYFQLAAGEAHREVGAGRVQRLPAGAISAHRLRPEVEGAPGQPAAEVLQLLVAPALGLAHRVAGVQRRVGVEGLEAGEDRARAVHRLAVEHRARDRSSRPRRRASPSPR